MLTQLIKNNTALLVQYAVASLLPLVLVPHFVYRLGLDEFGRVGIALALGNVLSVVVQYSFALSGPAMLAALPSGTTERSLLMAITRVKLGLALSVLAALALGNIALEATGNPHLSPAQELIVFLVVVGAAFQATWYLQARGHFFIVTTISAVGTLLALVVAFASVIPGDPQGLWAAAVSLTIGACWTGLVTWGMALRDTPAMARPASPQAKPVTRGTQLLRDGWSLFVSQFAATLYASSGTMVVGAIAGVGQAGAYAAVERLVGALAAAAGLTHTAAYPKLIALYGSDRKRYLRLLGIVMAASTTFRLVLSLIACLAWPMVLSFVFGDAGATAHSTLMVWSLVWLVLGVGGGPLTGYLVTSGQEREVMPMTFSVLVFAAVLGTAGTWAVGASGWMGALALAQLLVARRLWKAWRLEWSPPTPPKNIL
jgi:polysaccharide transporter, PST family